MFVKFVPHVCEEVAEQRRQLRRLYRATKFRKACDGDPARVARNSQCKPDQASRGAKQQRTIVDARMVGQFFRAYAAWVAQARVLQAGQDALASQKCWLMLALHSDNCGIHEKQQGFLKRHGTRSQAPKT